MRSALCAQLSAHVGSCTDVFSPPPVSGCPGLPCHGLALHACALRAQRAAYLQAQAMESNAATASSANRHTTTVWCGQSGFSRSLTARLPPCPYCALACVAPLLSCASGLTLCAGEILCLHAPAPLSKVRAIARAWISRVNGNFISSFPDSIGNKGARPSLAPGTSPTTTAALATTTPWP